MLVNHLSQQCFPQREYIAGGNKTSAIRFHIVLVDIILVSVLNQQAGQPKRSKIGCAGCKTEMFTHYSIPFIVWITMIISSVIFST